mgnify:CR=1 FL=1
MFFDTETDGLIEGDAIPNLHCICVYDKDKNKIHSFYNPEGGIMEEEHVGAAATLLIDAQKAQKMVYGFNSAQFDLRVMHAHAPNHLKMDIANLTIEHTDLLLDFAARKGYFSSLASLTEPFQKEKTLDAVESIALWRKGKLEKVLEYCAQDCRLVAVVWNHINLYGRYQRIAKSSKRLQTVVVDNFKPWDVAEAIVQAEKVDTSWMTDPPDITAMADWAIDIITGEVE